jgi:hypothetical protein
VLSFNFYRITYSPPPPLGALNGPVVHPGRSARTLKIHFTEPVTFGFFLVFTDWTVRA